MNRDESEKSQQRHLKTHDEYSFTVNELAENLRLSRSTGERYLKEFVLFTIVGVTYPIKYLTILGSFPWKILGLLSFGLLP